jgi:hypothetical protein
VIGVMNGNLDPANPGDRAFSASSVDEIFAAALAAASSAA